MRQGVTRERIYQTLFNLTANAAWDGRPNGFVTRSRRLKLWGDVPVGQRPALFQAEHDENSITVTRMPDRQFLTARWFVYTNAKDPNVIGSIEINNILDALDAVLKPDNPPNFDTCTLGGLVHYARIEGDTFKDPGDLDGDGMIVVPIKILVP